MDSRLQSQINFILEIDKLKSIYRRTYLINGERNENSAEHSWHVAMMAMTLEEYSDNPIHIYKVIRMMLVHDIVEIDAGDVFVYDTAGMAAKPAKEQAAAARLFGLLPDDQAAEFRALWEEFEAQESPEAKFAAALDRLMPLMHNAYSSNSAWHDHKVTLDQVLERNKHVADGSIKLWEYAEKVIRDTFLND